jgi:molybdate transport system substrate-binding protein
MWVLNALFALLFSATLHAAPARVYVAVSLTEALTDVTDLYVRSGGERPVLVFAGSPALARQIEAGAPAGVFLSADAEWMDWAAARGLVQPKSRRALAGNRLALVVPADRGAPVRVARGFRMPPGRWATGDPDAVPAGRYAKAALTALGGWDDAAPRLARTENVRAALLLVERGAVGSGIVYLTDARASTKVRLAGVFPATSHPPIVYPVALTTGAPPEARRFLAFLGSAPARRALAARGFTVP